MDHQVEEYEANHVPTMDIDEEEHRIDIQFRKRDISDSSELPGAIPSSPYTREADLSTSESSTTYSLGINRRLLPGPRRIHNRANSPQLVLPSESDGDLGAQTLNSKASPYVNQDGQESFNLARPRNRLVHVPRRPAQARDHSPIFQQALAQLFSPSRETPSTPTSVIPVIEEESPSIIGLGISSDRIWHGLGISDHTDTELSSVEAQTTAAAGSASLNYDNILQNLVATETPASAIPKHMIPTASSPPIKALSPPLRARSARFRNMARRRTISSFVPPQSASGDSPPMSSHMEISLSPSPYTPSPMVSEWASPALSLSSVYGTPSSSFPTFFANLAITTSPCPPSSVPTSPFLSPMAASPTVFSTPQLHTPVLAASSPSLASSPLVTQAAFASASAPPTADAAYANTQGNAAGNSTRLYDAVIATSIVGAIMFMGAFGLLALVLLRRRHFWQKPQPLIISHPQLISKSSDDYDDVESKADLTPPNRSSEVPTLPESVLPKKLWKDATASDGNGVSEFRHSVEQGLGDLMKGRAASTGDLAHRASMASRSPREKQSTFEASASPIRPPSLAYRPQRFSSLPNINALQSSVSSSQRSPVSRSSSFSSDRHTGHSSQTAGSIHEMDIEPSPEKPVTRTTASSSQVQQHEASRPSSPTFSVRSKESSKSSKSAKHALWALRKTAIIASANLESERAQQHTSPSVDTHKMSPLQPQTRMENIAPQSTDLSESINRVMFDEVKTVDTIQSRPLSQAKFTRNRTMSISAKSRPSTGEYAAPAILVTDHPQALVPPHSPKAKRSSVYSLTDSLPYLPSSASLASYDASFRDDASTLDPTMPPVPPLPEHLSGGGSIVQPQHTVEAEEDRRSSVSDSLHSTDTMDLDTDDEELRRAQRRRTLLYSVYRQSQSTPEGVSTMAGSDTRAYWSADADKPANTAALPQPPSALPVSASKRELVAAFPSPPPVNAASSVSPSPSITRANSGRHRSRTMSGGPKPELDAALTRFSRIDLASEFNLSSFGSSASLKSESKDYENLLKISPPFSGADGQSKGDNSRYHAQAGRQEVQDGFSKNGVTQGVRRTRSSTVGDRPVSSTPIEKMMTASRIPLPSRSKATRVSMMTALPSSSSIAPTRSIAQDLRASISFPSTSDASFARPTSLHSTYSNASRDSMQSGHRNSVIDYSTLSLKVGSVLPTTPAFNIPEFSSSRGFAGGLGLPKLDEEEDDDRSIYSRDSGSHESAWEVAKARVRARASLALPVVSEER